MSTRASFALRIFRLTRLFLHALSGWYLSYSLSRSDKPLKRERILREWSTQLVRLLGVEILVAGNAGPLPPACVLVANHVSWLDIFVLYTRTPGFFIAKSDIRGWPIVGGVIARAGTLFIERGSPRHARSVNAQMIEALRNGYAICLFPEGETTEGNVLRPFHTALFQPAIDAEATIVPVGLRYTDADGSFCAAPTYAGETTLLESLWRIVSRRGLRAELHVMDSLSALGAERRALARKTEEIIAAHLGLEIRRKYSETHGDPPDGPR